MAENKERDWDKGFGDNAGHGAENPVCVNCKYRKIIELPNGQVIDTGKGATCKKYPVLKPMDVMTTDGAECPEYKKDDKEKE